MRILQFRHLCQLGTGFSASQDKIHFLAHAAGHLAADSFNHIG